MKWHELLKMVADVPVFRTGFLAAGAESLPALRLQLSRWVKAGKLIQPAKGLYTPVSYTHLTLPTIYSV